MTVAQTLTHKVSQLSLDRQLEVLTFAELLEQKQRQAEPHLDLEGLLADQASGLSMEDFAAARMAAWGNFPR